MRDISIHALLAESDRRHRGNDRCPVYFYPRSPCGERLKTPCVKLSIEEFLSTLSLRRATHHKSDQWKYHNTISIHALLAESDPGSSLYHGHNSISIHALLAESDSRNGQNINREHTFLSTLSLRRATCLPGFWRITPEISIHALLAESDIRNGFLFNLIIYFYPRSPCGERRNTSFIQVNNTPFLSTLSLRRATA